MEKEYYTIMFDKHDLITLDAVLAEKKAHLRELNNDSEFYHRTERILNEVRDRLGWNG